MKIIPEFGMTNIFSRQVGSLAKISKPYSLVQKVIRWYISQYSVDTSEISKPVGAYYSLADFFIRHLKEGARPIESELIHPCDGKWIGNAKFNQSNNLLVKGQNFDVPGTVKDTPYAGKFNETDVLTYYLSPKDYHRVHMPLTGKIHWAKYVPGGLMPVNEWGLENVKSLYMKNERVVVGIESKSQFYLMIMVGATNVGSMSFAFDKSLQTNKKQNAYTKKYPEPIELKVGDEFGVFHMGSSVIFVGPSFGVQNWREKSVKMGQRLF